MWIMSGSENGWEWGWEKDERGRKKLRGWENKLRERERESGRARKEKEGNERKDAFNTF